MNHSGCSGNLDQRTLTRRQLLRRLGSGLGAMAFADLLKSGAQAARTGGLEALPHFAPKAKRVIFLYMSGGVSHLDSFDWKPELKKQHGTLLPESFRGGKDKPLPGMAGNQNLFYLAASPYAFKQHGRSGAWVSDQWPETAKVADDLCFIKGMSSEAVNHDPAMTFMNTGAQLPGRPSMGAWLSYGLGSESADLPAFIVLISRRGVDQPLSSRLWDSGFLPSAHQGVQFRAAHDPVLYLSEPAGVQRSDTRRVLDTLQQLAKDSAAPDKIDAELTARMAQYEMAFRMQTSVPEATDISHEPQSVFDLYGENAHTPGSLEANCILARRLAERGVRFIQLYHPGWDHHNRLPDFFPEQAKSADRACASLITDLKNHGMLEDTLVVWGTEFGRTAYSQGNISTKTGTFGRDHHRNCFTFWMAGGGVKPGMSYGETDEFGYHGVRDTVSVNDLHATMLYQLGITHDRFTFRFQGRDFRLTDVSGKVIKPILV